MDILEDHQFDVCAYLKSLKGVVCDYSDAQRNGWIRAVSDWFESSEDIAAKHIRGCYFHWMQSCERIGKIVARSSEDEIEGFLAICRQIPRSPTRERVVALFNAIQQAYPGTKCWVEWWLRHKDMLCRVWSNNPNFERLPNASNIAESQNAVVSRVSHTHMSILFRSILKLDENIFHNVYAHSIGLSLRYYRNDKTARKNRRNRSVAYMAEQGRAPDTIRAGIVSTGEDSPIIISQTLNRNNLRSLVRIPVDDEPNVTDTEPLSMLRMQKQTTTVIV